MREYVGARFLTDGKYLASVCVLTEGVAKIYVQTPDGRQAREVASAWSAQGFSGVAWAADSSLSSIAGPAPLARSLAAANRRSFSSRRTWKRWRSRATGNRLAYARCAIPARSGNLNWPAKLKPAGPATKLISSSAATPDPRISPDGRYIASDPGALGPGNLGVRPRCVESVNDFFGGPQIGHRAGHRNSRRSSSTWRASRNAELYNRDVDGGPRSDFQPDDKRFFAVLVGGWTRDLFLHGTA